MNTRYVLFLTILAASGMVLPMPAQVVNDGVTNTPSGETNPIMLPATGQTRFFRLFMP